MTTTILAALALSGVLAPTAKPEFQAQTDYGQALKRAAEEKKPMAVLIGKGDQFAKLMSDAGLSADAKKLLNDKYVCVNVDVTTNSGKKLADEFQLTDGLVISSAGGNYQALRQPGKVTATDLAKQATAYANVASTPATTVTAGVPAATAAPTVIYGSCPGGTCGTIYPAAGFAPSYSSCPGGNCGTVYPAGGYVFPSSSGSSCPNGNCPNTGRYYIR
jgi:hypothetical protein